MKDLHDIRSLSRAFSFEGAILSDAMAKTFKTRGTVLPADRAVVFMPEFFENEDKKKQWAAFCNKNRNYVADISLETVCREIEAFLMPVVDRVAAGRDLQGKWAPSGPWNLNERRE
jgi:hypothetical protein